MTYTITTAIDAPFDDVLTAVEQSLGSKGFGILTDIDVQETFQEKLDAEIDQYRILGACNPPLAHEGISVESDLGTLLPCNVAIYETEEGGVVVSAADPDPLLGLADNPDLQEITEEAGSRLERVFDELEDQFDEK